MMGSLLIETPAWLASSNHLLFNTAQIWRYTRGAQNLRLTKSRPWRENMCIIDNGEGSGRGGMVAQGGRRR